LQHIANPAGARRTRLARIMDTSALIVALGNPGPEYARTRHNFGFLTAELLLGQARERKSMRLAAIQAGGDCELYSLVVGGHPCLLVKPLTYMNLSGRAVAKVCGRHGVAPRDILVLHDELDLPLGRMKLKRGGGANGHRGVESIVEHLGCEDFLRLRLGIGRPQFSAQVSEYVLENFSETEAPAVTAVCEAAVKGAHLYFRRGQSEAVQFTNAFRIPGAEVQPETMDTPDQMR
jgi:peptidyl-tRNA hydrolase, PTH1 family